MEIHEKQICLGDLIEQADHPYAYLLQDSLAVNFLCEMFNRASFYSITKKHKIQSCLRMTILNEQFISADKNEIKYEIGKLILEQQCLQYCAREILSLMKDVKVTENPYILGKLL